MLGLGLELGLPLSGGLAKLRQERGPLYGYAWLPPPVALDPRMAVLRPL